MDKDSKRSEMEKNDRPERIRNFYHIATVGQDKKVNAKTILDALHIPYYIPSEDPDLSPTFRYLFGLPHLAGLVWLPSWAWQSFEKQAIDFPVEYYRCPGRMLSAIFREQYELFRFVIRREVPGLIIDASGFGSGPGIPVRVINGMFKGFEGFLPVHPDDGYALVLEIPPLFSWRIPVDKQDIRILSVPSYSNSGTQ